MPDVDSPDPLRQHPTSDLFHLIPPQDDFPYFPYCDKIAFVPSDTDFNPRNALWLADASLLAYSDEAVCRTKLAGTEFDHVAPLKASGDQDTQSGVQGFVAASPKAIIVSFRGTDISSTELSKLLTPEWFKELLHDWCTNTNIALAQPGWAQERWQGLTVHTGFDQALNTVWDKLDQALAPLLDASPRPLWFTGHSQGAALATLAALRHPQATGAYTFGSPLTVGADFQSPEAPVIHRVVHGADLVTRVPMGTLSGQWWPPTVEYRHIGHLRELDAHGKLTSPSPPPPASGWDFGTAIMRNFKKAEYAFRDLFNFSSGQALIDHSPVHYANRLRLHRPLPDA